MHEARQDSTGGDPKRQRLGERYSIVAVIQGGSAGYSKSMNRTKPAQSPIAAWAPSGEIARQRTAASCSKVPSGIALAASQKQTSPERSPVTNNLPSGVNRQAVTSSWWPSSTIASLGRSADQIRTA